jgi:hypothetical protein
MVILLKFLFVISFILCGTKLLAQDPFAVVMIDEKTETKLGVFPYERDKTATVIEILKEMKAKAIVLKYFVDLPKNEKLDMELVKAMSKIPVYLQARLDPEESNPNKLDPKNSMQVKGNTKKLLSGAAGWIPHVKFSGMAAGIGFVDAFEEYPIKKFPVVLKYQGMVYPSLYLLALIEVFGESLKVEVGKKVAVGDKSIFINERAEVLINFPAKDNLVPISFIDVYEKKISGKKVEGKVVILGYDGKNAPELETGLGKIKLHRAFYYALNSLYLDLR